MLIGNAVCDARPFDHRDDATQFFLERTLLRARARRFAADIERVRALLGQLQSVRDRLIDGAVLAAIGERIRRDVDDADHARAIELEDAAGAVELRGGVEHAGT